MNFKPVSMEDCEKSDICQPKVYNSVPSTANIVPRGKAREIDKDDLIIVKECGECSKKIRKAKKAFMCKCKEILYCSFDCKQASQHGCQERMKPVQIPLDQLTKKAEEICLEDPGMKERHEKFSKKMMKKVKSAEDFQKLADSGDPWTAYMIGSSYSNRLANMGGGYFPCYMSTKDLEKSVTETDEIAMKWFQIAAEGGLPDGMISLAHKIYGNHGLRTDIRVGFYWLAKAFEMDVKFEPETMELFENKPYLAGEIDALNMSVKTQLEALRRFGHHIQRIPMIGPNLGALLLAARLKELRDWNGKTFNGGVFYGFSKFSELMTQIDSCKLVPDFVAGRAGSASVATRGCVSAERLVTNIQFRQGEKGTTENGGLLDVEQITKLDKDAWYTTERTKFLVSCIHHQKQDFKSVGECSKCQDGAERRTTAVAEGLYSISITETVPGYGYGARYFTVADGNMMLETFKQYSQPEICCVLQCLMSNPADLHPLHLAEDPNLYWPIIWFYGSVYTALLQCCGEKVIKKIYGKLSKYRSKKIPSGGPAIPSSLTAFPCFAVGEVRMACGNEVCPSLDHSDKFLKFLKCMSCKVRYYCSPECQRADWKKHKPECSWGKDQ